jgi:hypothetical protein
MTSSCHNTGLAYGLKNISMSRAQPNRSRLRSMAARNAADRSSRKYRTIARLSPATSPGATRKPVTPSSTASPDFTDHQQIHVELGQHRRQGIEQIPLVYGAAVSR